MKTDDRQTDTDRSRWFPMTYLEMAYRTIKTFGFFDGSSVIAAVAVSRLLRSSGDKLKRLRTTGLSRPFFVRLGTSDRSVLQQIFIAREYECRSQAHDQAVHEFYEDALARSKTPVIIDCGANIGLASLWYTCKFPRAKIIAVEPEPENFRILTMNVAGYNNIVAVHGAVSDHETRVSLFNVGDEEWAWQTTEADNGEVSTYTIPGLTENILDAQLMIVKIDIEGGEVALFRSNLAWVSNTPVIVFEAHDWLFSWRGTYHAIASVLTSHARDYVQSGENTFSFSHSLLAPRRACP
jgi:FkbM family methyltransferase